MRSRVLLFELELQHLAGSGFKHQIEFQQIGFSTRQPNRSAIWHNTFDVENGPGRCDSPQRLRDDPLHQG